MRTSRVTFAGLAVLALVGGLTMAATAQEAEADATEMSQEVIFEMPIPADALPQAYVKTVVEDWTLAPGSDTSPLLANEAFRGRGIAVDGGEYLIEPATDALLWRGGVADAAITPAGEPVTLAAGDAIFLPAIPVAEVDDEVTLRIANPGTSDATALTFHTHDRGGSFFGFPEGLTLGPWDMAFSAPASFERLDGIDVLFRATRMTGGPGTVVPVPDDPVIPAYYVEDGELVQTTKGPNKEFAYEWSVGKNGSLPSLEGLEVSIEVVGDEPASILEFAVIPQLSPSD